MRLRSLLITVWMLPALRSTATFGPAILVLLILVLASVSFPLVLHRVGVHVNGLALRVQRPQVQWRQLCTWDYTLMAAAFRDPKTWGSSLRTLLYAPLGNMNAGV